MKRRELIGLISGAAIALPSAVMPQQPNGMRTVGILEPSAANDTVAASWRSAFLRQFRQLGWAEGQNVRFETLFADGDNRRIASQAAKLITSAPDIILAASPPVVLALKERTPTIPIVFVRVTDPVGGGLVNSLARPGGNITGFGNGTDLAMVSKRLQLLKEIAPSITRVAIFYNREVSSSLPSDSEAMAKKSGIDAIIVRLENSADIAGIARLANKSNTGLIVMPNFIANFHRGEIVEVAVRHHLPAMYYNDSFVKLGGLMAYSGDVPEQYRQAASYVDRILRGAKPADLPVQEPSKFEFAINLKAAKALGLTAPPSLLVQADEVIR